MNCAKRLTQLIDLHLSQFNDKDPCWEVRVSKIAGRGVFAARDIKRGEVIFREKPLLVGPSACKEDILNVCTICFKELDEFKFMCRQGCGLPICGICSKTPQHRAECELFRSWEPVEPNTANSVVIRLLTVARALLLTKDELDLIYTMQANMDNNHRTEVRHAAKCFRKFPQDKKIIDIINRSVAVVRTNGFDAPKSDKTTDNEQFEHRGLYPLFGVLNHDCVPNITFAFDRPSLTMTIKAAVDIPNGTELTNTYTKLFMSNMARHQFLRKKKHFICKCPRCSDPTEKGTFISALYCRNTSCQGLAVPETKDLPYPFWNCLECKQKSSHNQMCKSQDFACGALNAKFNAANPTVIIEYINEKSSNFIPSSNHIVIETKLKVIERLRLNRELFTAKEYKNKERYCTDILEILDKLGVGDCPMRAYLETEKIDKFKNESKDTHIELAEM